MPLQSYFRRCILMKNSSQRQPHLISLRMMVGLIQSPCTSFSTVYHLFALAGDEATCIFSPSTMFGSGTERNINEPIPLCSPPLGPKLHIKEKGWGRGQQFVHATDVLLS